jgi:hypothetical protein
MEEKLRYILTMVNEWLKFAEAKNGALLVADTAILFGVFTVLNRSAAQRVFIYLAVVLVIVSAISSLVSFIPQLKVLSFTSKKRTGKKANLLFYGDIAEHDPQSYIEALHAESGTESKVIEPMEVDYAQQIITNSRIAVRKYRCFNVGLYPTILALLFLLAASLISVAAL